MTSLPTQASIAETPVARVVLSLHADRWTGAIELRRGATEKRIQLADGFPVAVESNLRGESLADQLVDAGRISREDRDRVAELLARKQCAEGAAILALKLIEPKALFVALKTQMRRRICEAFTWTEGEWQLDPDAVAGEDAQPFRTDPVPLVRDALGEPESMQRLAADLAASLPRYPQRTRRFARIESRLGEDPTSASFRAKLDGRTTLARALGADAANPVVLATAWLLAESGALEFQDAPGDDGDAADTPEIEIEVVAPSAGHTPGATAGASATREKPEGDHPEAAKMRQEIEALNTRLDEDLSHYDVLSVEADAGVATIKKAYFKAAKRYHPDTLNRLGLGDLKDQAGEVFSRISEAYEVLSDSGRRKHYDDVLAGGGEEIDVERLAQAETFFRKGEILVKMGDFGGAIDFLQPAVDLWPAEAAYQSALGWALYKKRPPEPDAALEHLEAAVELNAEDAEAHSRLGAVLAATGDEARSAEHLAIAKRLGASA